MKKTMLSLLAISVVMISCNTAKTYFTSDIRTAVENNHQQLEKIQFYADRDIILTRELTTDETKVSSGKVKFENGHYTQIIKLKKNTPGVCTVVKNNIVGISFELGNNKHLIFSKPKNAKTDEPYRLQISSWLKETAIVEYEGKKFQVQADGANAGIKIKTSLLKKEKTEEREMKGRTIQD
ncbi:hypothetical protein ACQ33O_10860 [Ferruginibacter sp. SUN002]|uniref:hypothetical protein n=1 Tax=Ferruginibacter sp. SUN002 TaxID=2937789 RepID=UPI003D36FC0C